MTEDALTRRIIACAIEVHRQLGPGLLESAYEECLAHEFVQRGVAFERQKGLPLWYKGAKLDCGFRIDFLIESKVVVELKSIDELALIHDAQMLTYLRLTGCRRGLLINFNVPLLRDGIRRLVLNF